MFHTGLRLALVLLTGEQRHRGRVTLRVKLLRTPATGYACGKKQQQINNAFHSV